MMRGYVGTTDILKALKYKNKCDYYSITGNYKKAEDTFKFSRRCARLRAGTYTGPTYLRVDNNEIYVYGEQNASQTITDGGEVYLYSLTFENRKTAKKYGKLWATDIKVISTK